MTNSTSQEEELQDALLNVVYSYIYAKDYETDDDISKIWKMIAPILEDPKNVYFNEKFLAERFKKLKFSQKELFFNYLLSTDSIETETIIQTIYSKHVFKKLTNNE